MKKVSSVVWQFFDRLEENKRCVAVLCKLCDSEYKYFGNTTNLRAHLMKKHPIQWDLRQNTFDGLKTLDEPSTLRYEDEESTNQSSISPKRQKYSRVHKDKNVRFSLSIKNPSSSTAGEDSMPKIEIQRVDVLESAEVENEHVEHEDNEATLNLVRQMHDNHGSDEEWLEEDFQTPVEIYEPKRKNVQYRKIKREVITPPRQRTSSFYLNSASKPDKTEHIIIGDTKKDEYSVFGEYIANKLRKFKAPRTRGNIQQLITTILWQAEYGMYDDAETVKRVLMSTIDGNKSEQNATVIQDIQIQTEDMLKMQELNQSADSECAE